MAVTLPTYADNLLHPRWDHALTAAVPQLMRGVIEFGKRAKPTSKIFWDTKQYIEVDTDYRFRINWSFGGSDIHYGTPGTITLILKSKKTCPQCMLHLRCCMVRLVLMTLTVKYMLTQCMILFPIEPSG